MTLTEMATQDVQRRATLVADSVRHSEGHALAALIQDVSLATDLVSNVDAYESELIAALERSR